MKLLLSTAAAALLLGVATLAHAQSAATPPASPQDKVESGPTSKGVNPSTNEAPGPAPKQANSPADKLQKDLPKGGAASTGAGAGTNDTTGIPPRNPADKQTETQTGQ